MVITVLWLFCVRIVAIPHVLQQFYSQYLVPNVYIFKLSNTDSIRLIFTEEQFCHLIGFSYFGYDGKVGWDKLLNNPKKIKEFVENDKFNLIQSRILNFNIILSILNNPNIYIYTAEDYPEFRYKSLYFAAITENNRVFKLGIGLSGTDIHYGETYLVDMDNPKYNYYLKPDKLLTIEKREILLKNDFLSKITSVKEKRII